MVNVSFINIDDAKEILSNSYVGLFQEPFWWQIVEDGFDKECKVALVSENGSNKVIFPLFFHKIGPILRVGSPLRGTYTPYLDFIILSEDVSVSDQKFYLSKIVESLLTKGADWIEIGCKSTRDEIFCNLKENGFNIESPSTIILKTNVEKDILWNNMQGRARNLIRKAKKNGLMVNFLNSDLNNIHIFYSMLEDTFRKSGQNPPHSKDFYILLLDRLINSRNLLFISICKGVEVVAMGIFMHNANEIHFMSGTSTREGNKYGANNLLHWEVIKFASKNNIKQYNFGGLGIPTIDKFKRSFGGVEVEYRRYIWMKKPVHLAFNFLMRIKNAIRLLKALVNKA